MTVDCCKLEALCRGFRFHVGERSLDNAHDEDAMAQERRRRWIGYRVSVAKFQRPEADATNQPIAYQTRPLNWTFGNPLGAKYQASKLAGGVGVGGLFTRRGEGPFQPVDNPGKT